MANKSSEFSLKVDGVKGLCPPGEAWAKQHMKDGKIPVMSCEGPCVRGDIARRVANIRRGSALCPLLLSGSL